MISLNAKFSNDLVDRLLDNLESWVFYLFCSRCLKIYITFHESDFDQCSLSRPPRFKSGTLAIIC